MRIVAASDLHVHTGNAARMAAVAQAMCDSEAEVLVLAGDVTSGSADRYRTVLRLFARFPGPKVFVPGNHDLWLDAPQPEDTWRRYEQELPRIAQDSGFHYLDQAPLVVGEVAFIGSTGWYDFSYRQLAPPAAGLRLAPSRPLRDPGGTPRLFTGGGRSGIAWEDLTPDDYGQKGVSWWFGDEEGAPARSLIWNDIFYIDWGRTDEEMAEHFAGRLRAQAAEVAGKARAVVAVTHCVPFREALSQSSTEVGWAYTTAYMGSEKIGAALREIGNLKLALFGHSHVPRVFAVDEFAAANVSVAEKDAGPMLLEVAGS